MNLKIESELTKEINTFDNDPIQKFHLDTIKRSTETNERWGQAMFNHLSEIRPDLAEMIQGSEIDPFYSILDSKIQKFLSFLEIELRKQKEISIVNED